MKADVIRYSPDQWFAYAESAHRLVFKRERAAWLDRISFALLAVWRDEAVGYVTCRETDGESLYWQYGGTMDEWRGLASVRAFQALLDYTRDHYRRCTTYVKNDNIGYIHMLMKMGFRVIGVRCFEKEIFLELAQEFSRAVQE